MRQRNRHTVCGLVLKKQIHIYMYKSEEKVYSERHDKVVRNEPQEHLFTTHA